MEWINVLFETIILVLSTAGAYSFIMVVKKYFANDEDEYEYEYEYEYEDEYEDECNHTNNLPLVKQNKRVSIALPTSLLELINADAKFNFNPIPIDVPIPNDSWITSVGHPWVRFIDFKVHVQCGDAISPMIWRPAIDASLVAWIAQQLELMQATTSRFEIVVTFRASSKNEYSIRSSHRLEALKRVAWMPNELFVELFRSDESQWSYDPCDMENCFMSWVIVTLFAISDNEGAQVDMRLQGLNGASRSIKHFFRNNQESITTALLSQIGFERITEWNITMTNIRYR